MYDHFTDRARRAMIWAAKEAERLGHKELRPEHILLGLLQDGHGLADAAITLLDVDPKQIRAEVEKLSPASADSDSGRPHMGQLASTVVAAAEEYARSRNTGLGTDCLLLGLLQVEPTAALLTSLGITTELVHEKLGEVLGTQLLGDLMKIMSGRV